MSPTDTTVAYTTSSNGTEGGINFLDPEIPTITDSVPETKIQNPFELPAPSSFDDWQQIDAVDWTTGMGTGVEIKSYALVTYLQRLTPFFRFGKGFKTFTFDSLEFRVTFNAVSANSGMIRVSWCPIWEVLDLFRASQLSSVALMAATGTGFDGEIPLITPNRMLGLDIANNLCALHMHVEHPLANTTGTATSVTIAVYVRPKNLRFASKLAQDGRSLTAATSSTTAPVPLWAPTAIAQGKEKVEKSSRGLVSGVAEDVAKVASLVSAFPPLTPIASMVSMAATGVGAVAKFFGLGKPTSLQAVTYTMNRQGQHLAGANGLDTSVSLYTDPDQSLAIMPQLMGEDNDISNFELIAAKYSLVSINQIASGATVGALATTPIANPALILSDGATPPAQLETNCAFVLNQFSLWKGKPKMKFSFSPDGFTKGIIFLVISKNGLPTPLTPAALGDYFVEVVEINGPTVYETTLPAVHSDIAYYHRSCTAGTPDTNFGYQIGLYLHVPFKTAGVAATVWYSQEICVEDLQLNLPCNKPITTQGLFAGANSVGPSGGLPNMKVKSFRELFRRYSRTSGTGLTNPWTLNSEALRVMNKFAYFRGSLRTSYNIILADQTKTCIARAVLSYPGDPLRATGTPAAISQSQGCFEGAFEQNVLQNSELVVETPFVGDLAFLWTKRLDATWYNRLPIPLVTLDGPAVLSSVHSYVAFGDDMQFGVLLPSVPYYVT